MNDNRPTGQAALVPDDHEGGAVGRIVAHHGKVVKIAWSGGELEWKRPHREEWVVGDLVLFEKERPKRIKPRKNEFIRKGPGGGVDTLAANLDFLLIVTCCGDLYKPALLDRFIVAATHAGITPLISLNKTDLPDSDEYKKALEDYSSLGYRAIPVSAVSGEGLEELGRLLSSGISAMVGQSGVGKTSILNRIAPGYEASVAEISGYSGKGRHTTTMAVMIPLPGGGAVIDSPGIRQFAPAGIEPEDLAHNFPGVGPFSRSCKFRDCTHETEPGCAVKNAVDAGELAEERYSSYLRILDSIRDGRDQDWWRRPEK